MAAVLLRTRAARFLNVDPRDVPVRRDCSQCGKPHGKTQLPGTGLEASVTHSGSIAGVALARGVAVGLDVERIVPIDYAELVGSVASAAEPSPRTAAEFFRSWTRKESVVKATGEGLTRALTEVVVSPPDAPPAVVSYGGRSLRATLFDLHPAPGYAAALTLLTGAPARVTEHGIGVFSR